jgi:hypothetical protein
MVLEIQGHDIIEIFWHHDEFLWDFPGLRNFTNLIKKLSTSYQQFDFVPWDV